MAGFVLNTDLLYCTTPRQEFGHYWEAHVASRDLHLSSHFRCHLRWSIFVMKAAYTMGWLQGNANKD